MPSFPPREAFRSFAWTSESEAAAAVGRGTPLLLVLLLAVKLLRLPKVKPLNRLWLRQQELFRWVLPPLT